MIKVKKGLNVPIVGSPTEDLDTLKNVRSVAIIGSDYHGMRPTMLVEEGDTVKLGQALFEDKKNPGVIFTSPGAGKIESINRGPRRALQSISLGRERINQIAIENGLKTIPSSTNFVAGLWTAFRTRPFSKIPVLILILLIFL